MGKGSWPLIMFFLLFAILGAILLTAWSVMFFEYLEFNKTAKEATATITVINTYTDRDGDTRHMVFVKFYVGGQEYGGEIGHWDIAMAVGKTVTIRYNTNNPYDFRISSEIINSWPFLLVGVVFFLTGFIPSLKMIKRRLSSKWLLAKGKRIMATFCDVAEGNVSMNRRFCYNIICEYNDSATSTTYLFKSENLWEYFPQIQADQQMPLVPVYVNPNDYSKYNVAAKEFITSIRKTNGYQNVIDYT